MQLTGTQTANQMMDPTRRIRHDRGGGEAAGVATTEPEDEGRCGQLPRLCVCRLVCECLHADMLMSVGGYFGTCSLFFHSSHILHLDPK